MAWVRSNVDTQTGRRGHMDRVGWWNEGVQERCLISKCGAWGAKLCTGRPLRSRPEGRYKLQGQEKGVACLVECLPGNQEARDGSYSPVISAIWEVEAGGSDV